MKCRSFQNHDDSLMEDFSVLPNRLYADDPWYRPVTLPQLKDIFNTGSNPFFQYGEARQFIVYRDNRPVTRCAAARNPMMDQEGQKVGTLGYFESENDPESALCAIRHGLDWLRGLGVNIVYGPMNFSIWRGYRFRTGGFDVNPYLGDLYNKEYYSGLFENAGFSPVGLWRSAEVDVQAEAKALQTKQAKQGHRLAKALEAGYQITPYNGSDEKVFKEVKDLVMESYADFLGFYPLSDEEFNLIFGPLKRVTRPGQLLLVRKSGKLCGFLIQHWDWAPVLRTYHRAPALLTGLRLRFGPVPKRWIISMAGVRREATRSHVGLGSALIHEGIEEALRQGATHLVYSLMSETNRSNAFWSGIPAKITTYHLFRKSI